MTAAESVRFPSGTLELEGALVRPSTSDGRQSPGLVLCHPHPLYGGTMDHPILLALEGALASRGFSVLRFNLRGVGRSCGTHAGGPGELEDVKSSLDFLASVNGVDPGALGVIGYSFGAAVGLEVGCMDPRVRVLVAVAPPLSGWPMEFCTRCPKPKQVWVGDRDEHCPTFLLEAWWRTVSRPRSLRVLRSANHHLIGCEEEIARGAADFAAGVLGDHGETPRS